MLEDDKESEGTTKKSPRTTAQYQALPSCGQERKNQRRQLCSTVAEQFKVTHAARNAKALRNPYSPHGGISMAVSFLLSRCLREDPTCTLLCALVGTFDATHRHPACTPAGLDAETLLFRFLCRSLL